MTIVCKDCARPLRPAKASKELYPDSSIGTRGWCQACYQYHLRNGVDAPPRPLWDAEKGRGRDRRSNPPGSAPAPPPLHPDLTPDQRATLALVTRRFTDPDRSTILDLLGIS